MLRRRRARSDPISKRPPVAAKKTSTKKRKGSTGGGKVSGKKLRAAREARQLPLCALVHEELPGTLARAVLVSALESAPLARAQ